MIEIKELTKIFKSKKGDNVKALDNVSFSLPNKGFIFVTGKSGSGKTTLLSLIGGLDKFNSGEIVVNGVSLSKLKGRKFDYYRNETIGFIFQDYQLFEELTVYENIKLALDFKHDQDVNKIKGTLKDVGLEGYENRYPRELSGGEKQRVAIARVLVKNVSIILADEPTGNLDFETTNSILEILKNISKDCLVLIVSHNIYDAYRYGDYILELQEGRLLGTYKRNEEIKPSIEIKDGILRLPLHKKILESEKENIINNPNYKIKDIIQDDQDFSSVSLQNETNGEEKPLSKNHISFLNAFKRGINFLKQSLTPMIVFSFITASLFALINASFAIKNIDQDRTKYENLVSFNNDYYYFASEGELDDTRQYYFSKDDVVFDKLRKANYQGDIYKSYRSNFTNINRRSFTVNSSPSNILQVDKEYVEKRFGEIEYVAKASQEEDYGFYCFDYYIDFINAMFPQKSRDYESYLGFGFLTNRRTYLNGIIKTDYKTKYDKFLNIIFEHENYLTDMSSRLKSLDKGLYDDYILDYQYYFNNLITFNTDIIDSYVNHPFNLYVEKNCNITNLENTLEKSCRIPFGQTMSFNAIDSTLYSALTGNKVECLDYYKKVDPVTLKIVIYNDNDNLEYNKKEYEFVFDHVTRNKGVYFNVKKDDSLKFFKDNIFNLNGFILDSSANLKNLNYNNCFDDNYYLQNNIVVATKISSRLNVVFNKVFSLLIAGLLLCAIISSAVYGVYVVKSNMRNIGICKSLGSRTIDILIILALNLFIAIGLTIIFYCGLAELLMVVIESIFHRALESSTVYLFPSHYKLLFNNPIMYIVNIALIVAISIFSFVGLFIKVNSLKPIDLIKSRK